MVLRWLVVRCVLRTGVGGVDMRFSWVFALVLTSLNGDQRLHVIAHLVRLLKSKFKLLLVLML